MKRRSQQHSATSILGKTLLSIFLLLAHCPIHAQTTSTWDGTTKTAPDMSINNGSTETLAIQIGSAAELAWLGDQMRQGNTANGKTHGGKYWKLTADIDLGGESDLTGNDWSTMIGNNTTNAFCGYFDGNGKKVSNIQVASITSGKYYGLFPSIQGASSSDLSKVQNLKIDGVYLKATASMGATTRLGALTGYVKNGFVSGVAASNVNITYEDGITGANHIGGLIGCVEGTSGGGQQTTIKNNSVKNVNISIGGAVAEATYIGGAIGLLGGYALVDGMSVDGGSITGPTTDMTVANNKQFFVGGFLGLQNSTGTTDYQPNKFKNIAVKALTINLSHYVPASTIANHKFSVGGIAGSVCGPNQDSKGNRGMPENLIAKSIKIYAPWASVSPTVSNFNTSAAVHNNLTSEIVTTVDALERSKTASWYYNDFKLGLSAEFLNSTAVKEYNAAPAQYEFRKNYSVTPKVEDGISYLAISEGTLLRQNRYVDNYRDSWTVLWWTNQGTRDDTKATPTRPAATMWTDTEQPIYPQSGATYAQLSGNLSDYPYYMYFYQGVANAHYANTTDADAIIAGIAANMSQSAATTLVTLTISNDKEDERGFDECTISVSASSDAVDVTDNYTYQWYLNGKAHATGTSINLTPHWKDGQGLTVNALSGTTVVATANYTLVPGVMKTKAGTTEKVRSDYTGRGTSGNPYIIDCENALRQLSYLSTAHTALLWEGIVKPSADPKSQSQGHYDRAYYELGDDITMSKDPFVPISHMGYSSSASDGTYAQGFIFQGSFDGKGHKISNLNITWSAGQYNGGANVYHGLFGAVGNTTASKKWQDASTGSTIIKNLIIDGATLTHDANNTSFYYNNGTSGNANNCMVGVLVGIVGSNTTIQNIEIRNSKITDADSYDYSLAKYGLYVGGAIGSVQYSSVSTAVTNLPANTKIDHIAAQVDITLTHPTFVTSPVAAAEVSQFNIGGIIGRYIATNQNQTAVQGTLPQYTFYSGNINAPKAWISPVLAAVRYTSQQGAAWTNFSKQWEGNNNSAATQLTITNAQYYNFRIIGQLVSDLYPVNVCGNYARSIVAHTDGSDAAATYDARRYQGVNYGARFIDSDETTLYFMNQEPAEHVYWVWDDEFPHMTAQQPTEAYIDRDGNSFTAEMTEGTGSSYRWQISFDGESWTDIDGATLQNFIANPSSKTKLIVAYVTSGGTEYRTQIEAIWAGSNPFDVYIDKTGDSETGYTFNVVWKDGSVPAGTLTPTYQWYKFDKTTAFTGQTGTSLTLSQSELDAAGGYIWCAVTVKEMGTTVYKWMLVAGDLTVVYVNGKGYSGNSAGAGNDNNNGKTPQTPVKTIDKANSLLDGGSWDKNIIVVMGELASGTGDANAFKSKGPNPATLTGKWDGVDYEGKINLVNGDEQKANPGDGLGKTGLHNYVSADTKFENLVFRAAGSPSNCFFDCHGHDVWFGKGLRMLGFANLSDNHGNLDEDQQTIPEFSVLLTASNLAQPGEGYWTRSKPQTLTIESGHYGRILGGRFIANFFDGGSISGNTAHSILGTAQHPAWAVINIDIDKDNDMKSADGGTTYTCDVNCIVGGLTDGSIYGDYEINVRGGNVRYIVGANQGNGVRSGSKTFTPAGSTKNANFGQWPNSSFFGRSIINVEQNEDSKPILINNLYAGGLGRYADKTDATVDMYVYGKTEVNIKSGTILGNVYGGGAGGVLGQNPWDPRVPYATTDADNTTNAIINGVQYGTWGSKKAGDPLADVILHKRDDYGNFTSETETLNLANSSTTVNISGGTIGGSVYGGGDGFVSNMPVNKKITMQGVGSIFGLSNINISGGTITGSIYGGSKGSDKYYEMTNVYGQTINHIAEMNGMVNLTISGTEDKYPTIGGSIFGAGQGIASNGSQEYLRIATTGNNDLGAQYTTSINITIDMPESVEFPNDIYGGGQMGKVDGNTNIVLKRGHFTGRIYGGGDGEMGHPDKGMVTGSTTISTGSAVRDEIDETSPVSMTNATIYGGANLAQVVGNTNINLFHGDLSANVYGGGKGLPEAQRGAFTNYGKVTGNTTITIDNRTENNQITGTIYGGGALGNVEGNTTLTAINGAVDGDLYGGGALADIEGNTVVNLNGGAVGSVYGGGLGAKSGINGSTTEVAAIVTGDVTITLNGSIVNGEVFGCNNLNGTPKGHVLVDVKATNAKGTETQEHPYHVAAVYGGGNLAAYSPTDPDEITEVIIENCGNSIEDVFGGGNAATVPNTQVTIWGGVIGRVFAGGNGASAPADVTNNTHAIIHGGTIGEVYGGSNSQGFIGGTIHVDVNEESYGENPICPIHVASLFGGGNRAASNAGIITLGCVDRIDYVYGGANNANVTGDVTLNVTSGTYKAIFGGNNVGGTVSGNITVNIEEKCDDIHIQNLYGGGNMAAHEGTTHVNVLSWHSIGNIFGGGLGTTASVGGTQVIIDPTLEKVISGAKDHYAGAIGSVFGGGNAAPVNGNTSVYIKGGTGENQKVTIGNYDWDPSDADYLNGYIFGGGNQAPINQKAGSESTTGNTEVTITGHTHVMQNVYGGGNGGEIKGSTHVVIE